MDFVEALKQAKKLKAGLRPARWRKPYDEDEDRVDLTACAYRPYRYYGKDYLIFCTSGTLRPILKEPKGTLMEIKDLLGEWDVITEQELNEAHRIYWKRLTEGMNDSDGESV